MDKTSAAWLHPTSTIKIEIFYRGRDLDLIFVVPPEVMAEALAGIDHAKEAADACTRMLCTSKSEADQRREARERIADTARHMVLDLLSRSDTVNGYPPKS